ncbi:MAG: hypothetical protein SFY92_05935 [Verrucomicrobiae bacterium]|nr:hypothetical protein [Verrucomicrobiae bacterium]
MKRKFLLGIFACVWGAFCVAAEEPAATPVPENKTEEKETTAGEPTPSVTPAPKPDWSTPDAAAGSKTDAARKGQDEVIEHSDGSRTVIVREDPASQTSKQVYDPYRRTSGDSAKSPEVRQKEAQKLFPEEMKKEAERKAAREARPQAEKDRERELMEKTPATDKYKNPTIKQRDSIPKRF